MFDWPLVTPISALTLLTVQPVPGKKRNGTKTWINGTGCSAVAVDDSDKLNWQLDFFFKYLSTISTYLQTPPSLIDSFIRSPFSSRSSEHHYTQTVRARGLKFWQNVLPPPRVTCHVSGVMCHMSPIFFFFFCYLLFGQSDGASQWRVCYQPGLPHLVFFFFLKNWSCLK